MNSSNRQKSDPVMLLHKETEILLTRIRLIEVYIGQAQAIAANEIQQNRESFEAELLEKDRVLQNHSAAAAVTERRLQTQIDNLRNQLEQRQGQLDNQEGELQSALNEIGAQRRSIVQLEQSNERATATLTNQATRIQQELEPELAALRAELVYKDQVLAERRAAESAAEQFLHGQIRDLQSELADKDELLESRDREFHSAKSESAALRERISESETAGRQAEVAASREAKRSSLDRPKAAVDGLEHESPAQPQELKAQSADIQAIVEDRKRNSRSSEVRMTAAQRERILELQQVIESSKSPVTGASHLRRWRSASG